MIKDGASIVFTTVTDNCLHLVAANADGTDRQRVQGCGTGEGDWSPDSSRLLVTRYNRQKNRYEIWDTTLDGSSKRFVLAGEDASWRPQ